MYAYNTSIKEDEVGGPLAGAQPGLHSEFEGSYVLYRYAFKKSKTIF